MQGPSALGEAVIPSRSNRKLHRDYDKEKYKGRNVVERAINKLKFYRRVATRYDKLIDDFLCFVLIAATSINLK
jgi:putative transposase